MTDQNLAAEAAARFLASPLGKFRPWVGADGRSPQREFLAAASRSFRRVFRGGNGSGKTTVGVVEALLRCLGYLPGVARPPVWGWLSALDWEFGVGQILWPRMREYLPMDEVRTIQWFRRAEPSLPQTILFRNGSRVDFKSAESGERKYQGAQLDFFGADEEHPWIVIEEVLARLMRKKQAAFWTTLTPVRRERWVLDLERQPGTTVIRASTKMAASAGILDLNRVEALSDALSDRQRSVRIEGDFAQLEGLVYPEFSRMTHAVRPRDGYLWYGNRRLEWPWPLPPSWPRYAAMDFGFSVPSAVVISARDPVSGTLVIERCYFSAGVRLTRWVELLKRALPPLAAPMLCDHDSFARAELAAAGLPIVSAMKDDFEAGIEAVERRLRPQREMGNLPGLVFVMQDDGPPRHPEVGRYDTAALVHEMEGYRYQKAPNDGESPDKKDRPVKRDDHSLDALRYIVYYLDRRVRSAEPMQIVPATSHRDLVRAPWEVLGAATPNRSSGMFGANPSPFKFFGGAS